MKIAKINENKKADEIAREYFPDITDEVLSYIIWEKTGYPVFWQLGEDGNTPEECFRKQLQTYKDNCESH